MTGKGMTTLLRNLIALGVILGSTCLSWQGIAYSAAPVEHPAKRKLAPTPVVQSGTREPDSQIRFIATEILGRPTDKSVTVNVVPAQEMEIYYEYGTATGTYTARTVSQLCPARVPIETVIDKLQPNTRYYYRIRHRHPGAGDFATGEEHTFVTQRPRQYFCLRHPGRLAPRRH